MNIKSITPNIIPLDGLNKTDQKEKVRFQESTERDANGKQERESESDQRRYTEEEWLKAVEDIKKLPAVVKNQLQVEVIVEGDRRFVKILSLDGDCIRRLTEWDVRNAIITVDVDRPKGQLLNKAL